MPKTSFATENRIESDTNFPTLKFVKDERARVVCVEPTPHYEWTHRMVAPKIVNGVPVMKTTERRNGDKVEENDMDFIGMPICYGDDGILRDKGVDVGNCVICAKSVASDMFPAPVRRFAMHVLRYATRPGGFDLATPFVVSTVVWKFNEKTYNKLIDLANEWGNLQAHDLLLGPCTVAMYQNFEIAISAKAEWLGSEERKATAAQTLRENRAKDLAEFCGRKTERRWIDDDIQKIERRWAEARGQTMPQPAGDPGGQQDASLSAGLDDLLSQAADTPIATVPLDLDTDLFADAGANSTDVDVPPPTPEPAVVAAAPPVPPQQPVAQAVAAPAVVPEAAAVAAVDQGALDALLTIPVNADAAPDPEPAAIPKPGSSGETVDFNAILAGLE